MSLEKLFSRVKKEFSLATLALLFLSALAIAPIIAPVAKAAASITLNPTSGSVGTTVSVTGSGFTPNGQIEIFINGAVVTTTTAASNGTITASFTVPNSVSPGPYNVAAKDVTTGISATATFDVTGQPSPSPSPTPTPSPTPADLNYTVTVQNDQPSIHVKLEIENITTTELTLKFEDEASYVENYTHNLSASSDGRSLSVTDTGQGMWMISPGGSSATFEYDIDKIIPFGYNTPEEGSISVYFNDQGGVIMAPFFFIYPDVTDADSVTIKFDVPAGWQVVTPYRVEGDHLKVQRITNSLLIDFLRRQQIYMGIMKFYAEQQVGNCTVKLGVLEADEGGDARDSFGTQADVENALNVSTNILENLVNLFGENPYEVFTMYSQFSPSIGGPVFTGDRYNGNGANYWPEHRWNELVGHMIYAFMSFDVQIGWTAPLVAHEDVAKGLGEMYYGPKLAWRLFNDPIYLGGLYNWYLVYERFCQSNMTGYWEFPVYVKGPFVALMLDSEIQNFTGGVKSLDDVLKYLYSTYKNTGHSVDWHDIQDAVGAVTGNDFQELFSQYAYGNETIPYKYIQDYQPYFLEYPERYAEAFPFINFPDFNQTIPLFINIEMAAHEEGHIPMNVGINAGDNVRAFANYVLSHYTITDLTEKDVEDSLSAITGANCSGFFTRWEDSFGRLSLDEVKQWLQSYSNAIPEFTSIVILPVLVGSTMFSVIVVKKKRARSARAERCT